MNKIQLLTVDNTLSRRKTPAHQQLSFVMLVENIGYGKEIDVVWAAEDGSWHSLSAVFVDNRGDGFEYWRAETVITGKPLPGRIRFALRVRCNGDEYWDNNLGRDYFSRPGSGIVLAAPLMLQNLDFTEQALGEQQWLNIKVAANPLFAAESITIHWTCDNWRHSHQTACHLNKQGKQALSQFWSARLHVKDAFRLQYSISADNRKQQIWDNNGGKNYHACRKPLKVLILNLHCYQEEQQDYKFSQIAKAIDELSVDIVCFQEVAEHWNHGQGDWASNSANIINQRLSQPMQIHSDWSHLGFDQYREGVAILSRYPLQHCESRYVSDSSDIYNINSRKVVMARVAVPYMGLIDVYSAHLSWWEGGFQQQFQSLCEWADSLQDVSANTVLLCGDFNIAAGSTGYRQVVDDARYEDQYLAANAQGLFEQIFRVNDAHWRNYLAEDYRIDYIFMNKTGTLQVSSARTLFTEQDYGPVSDHCGYLMTFEPKQVL